MDARKRLFVLWRDPASGSRHVVGRLWRERAEYCFAYATKLKPAEECGFMPLAEFPDLQPEDPPYRSRYLFPTFARRIPSPARPDREATLREWGVAGEDDPLEILAKSGGVLLTDGVELAEYRAEGDELLQPLEFRVTGERHQTAKSLLNPGDKLQLKRDPSNPHDPNATLILSVGGERIGYVPKQYTAMIARLLDANVPIDAVAIRRLMLPAETGRWVVRVQRTS